MIVIFRQKLLALVKVVADFWILFKELEHLILILMKMIQHIQQLEFIMNI
jgi:hypothetical protein